MGVEECDNGAATATPRPARPTASSRTSAATCKVGPGEECDDGNDNDADACKNDCKLTTQVSCKAIKTGNPAAKDGVYTIDVDGPGPKQSFKVYCDMTTDGGGWQIMNYLRKPQHWDIPIFHRQRRRRRHARRLLLGPDPPDRQRQLQGAHHHLPEPDRVRRVARQAVDGQRAPRRDPLLVDQQHAGRLGLPRQLRLRRPHRERRLHPRLQHLPRLRHGSLERASHGRHQRGQQQRRAR
jgi:hypothetical protein